MSERHTSSKAGKSSRKPKGTNSNQTTTGSSSTLSCSTGASSTLTGSATTRTSSVVSNLPAKYAPFPLTGRTRPSPGPTGTRVGLSTGRIPPSNLPDERGLAGERSERKGKSRLGRTESDCSSIISASSVLSSSTAHNLPPKYEKTIIGADIRPAPSRIASTHSSKTVVPLPEQQRSNSSLGGGGLQIRKGPVSTFSSASKESSFTYIPGDQDGSCDYKGVPFAGIDGSRWQLGAWLTPDMHNKFIRLSGDEDTTISVALRQGMIVILDKGVTAEGATICRTAGHRQGGSGQSAYNGDNTRTIYNRSSASGLANPDPGRGARSGYTPSYTPTGVNMGNGPAPSRSRRSTYDAPQARPSTQIGITPDDGKTLGPWDSISAQSVSTSHSKAIGKTSSESMSNYQIDPGCSAYEAEINNVGGIAISLSKAQADDEIKRALNERRPFTLYLITEPGEAPTSHFSIDA